MNKEDKTQEPQYQRVLELESDIGQTRLGLMTNYVWHDDPRRLLFLLSRYKFVSKLISGKKNVLEVGCGDAFGTRVVLQEVEKLMAVDFDPVFIKDIQERMEPSWSFECKVHDMLDGPIGLDMFDAAYSLDVLEHIALEQEEVFLTNIVQSLTKDGVLIIGMPSLESQAYASEASKEGHVNCKNQAGLKQLLSKYFDHVFIFSMNDEVVHTGFSAMAHYLIALCCGKKYE